MDPVAITGSSTTNTPVLCWCFFVVLIVIINLMLYKVPFVSNTPDDLHCAQAVWMMILKYFRPDYKISIEELSKKTGFEGDKGTWPIAGIMWMHSLGFEVKHIEKFDFHAFAKDGKSYLEKRYTGEARDYAIQNTNFPQEQERAKQFIKTVKWDNRAPTSADLKELLDNKYLVRVHVNARKLYQKEGYAGHAVLVIGYDNSGYIIHDPGSPPKENWHLPKLYFELAWADSDEEAKELTALKPKDSK